MSQHIDLDAFRSGYKAKMGISDEPTQEIVKTPAALPDVSAADDIDPDAITDLGDIEPLDITTHDGSKPVGLELPQEAVMGTLAAWRDTAQEEIDDVSQTLHTLRNSLKTDLYETKSLAEQSGLSFYVVDSDPAFARKKIESDTYAGMLRSFADNARDIPQTTAFLRETDTLERLALTGDEQLSILEKQLNADGGGFFNSGYIAAARNAWNTGMMSREIGDLANKWMAGGITEDERHRLDVLRDAQAYYQGRRDGMGLLERMVRGTVESVGTPLYGGLAGAAGMLGRYGKEGLAGGAMVGAGIGSAVGGVGAVPGAIAGGLTGMGAVAQTGFVNDMMRQEGGQTFLTLMDMGAPEDTARVLAIAAGGFKGALEYVGLKQIGKIFPGAENFLTQEAAGAALKALERNPSLLSAIGSGAVTALRGIAGEVATENLQDVVDIVAEDVGRRFAGGVKAPATVGEIAGRLWETTTQTLESVALLGGAGGIVRGVHNYTRNNQREDQLASLADNQKRIVDTVAQAVQSSPVMQNMGDTGEALIQHLSDNGVTPETLYLTPEIVQQVFFQSEDPALMAAAAEMGITPESLQENLTLGTDVAVPFSKASTHILKDPERYAALREDIRLSPAMPTDAELEELAAMNQDAEARLAYLDDLLAPVAEEVDAAQTRFVQRMGIAAPYVEQLRDAGYSENQANAYGLVLAANAERMAPVFGMTPQQYLQERFAGYYGMTQEEFTRLAQGGLEGLFENRDMAAMLQDMGIKKGMSATKRRRALQPEFGFAYGRINPESVQHLYGMQRYNELRQQFGPGFFAKKGEGLPIDVLAQNFEREERGGYDLPAGEIDADAFAEKIFSPHDEFESGLVDQLRQNVLWQFVGEQGAGRLDTAEDSTRRLDNLAVARDME
ncbi:MAG: hypothetical protein IJU37_11135, partial [Desulfovibrio sp.]|nr:hypothetical protein [Desulfovibrio sp.]